MTMGPAHGYWTGVTDMADPKDWNVRDKEVQAADGTENIPTAESPQPLVPRGNRATDLATPRTGTGEVATSTPSAPPELRSQGAPAPPQVSVVVNQSVNQQQTAAAGAGVLQRNWLAALILAIFLGWLGIDSFYLGQPGKGILKLFTLGLFGILWVIDTIMIATKSVRNIEWK